ncbi:hypothetical protein BV61_06050 [Candidatus Synechococcus spongiarum LMB bulk15M]|uniref:Uncharacterized protein n=1 Tax=Candidatus Synechococcus spongiarum LMB bulk15M TaxID=1943582 RepID=A0A1T1CIJ2_9SYNE|nr:hypothetical protein BV61_06050 [Candidatus Synechococcus spongiarum LMB bulk15M]
MDLKRERGITPPAHSGIRKKAGDDLPEIHPWRTFTRRKTLAPVSKRSEPVQIQDLCHRSPYGPLAMGYPAREGDQAVEAFNPTRNSADSEIGRTQ